MRLRPLLPLALLLPVVPWSQAQIDRRAGPYRAQEEVLYLWSGAHVKRLFPDAIMIFIAPPDLAALEARLRRRGDTSEADIARRLAIARDQIAESETLFEHRVVNDDLDAAVRQVAGILDGVPNPPVTPS